MSRRKTILRALLCALALVLMGAPRAAALAPPSSGDPALIAIAGEVLGRSYREIATVAYVDTTGTRFANFGATEEVEYEIGSVTKTFTAELFVDAVRRGEVREDTKVGQLLPLDGTAVADVTLLELASHTSGLPQFPVDVDTALAVGQWMIAENPFTFDGEELLAQMHSAPLTNRGNHAYSTVGYALLGQALAAAAHTDYRTLLTERMLIPLGLSDTWLPLTAAELPDDVTRGFDALHRSQAPWPLAAYAPSGGLRSTGTDMAGYARQLLDGSVGPEAMDRPLTWSLTEYEGRTYTVHGGATGGFQCTIVLDRAHDRALVILTNTIGALDKQAMEILGRM
ncbi:MAG: serine hydrolase domain-containing protein [Rhodococcus sp. (in: high G+C Gram-positive bacteria)]|uniref:serine hydrolase domain-containing protein n=1 Tax=Rhodococcus sp. TaxID=1831 RepID=UPI003BAFA647